MLLSSRMNCLWFLALTIVSSSAVDQNTTTTTNATVMVSNETTTVGGETNSTIMTSVTVTDNSTTNLTHATTTQVITTSPSNTTNPLTTIAAPNNNNTTTNATENVTQSTSTVAATGISDTINSTATTDTVTTTTMTNMESETTTPVDPTVAVQSTNESPTTVMAIEITTQRTEPAPEITTMPATTTPAPLMVSSIIEEARQALNQTNSSINATKLFNGVVLFVEAQNEQEITAFAGSTTGMAIGEIIDANNSAVLEDFTTRFQTRERKIFFYAIMLDVVVKASNTDVTNFFLDSTTSNFNYTLREDSLLEVTCDKLEAAGGTLAGCPQDTTTTPEPDTTALSTTTTAMESVQTTVESSTSQPLQLESIIKQIEQALQQSTANKDVNATELFEGVLIHVENQTDAVVDEFANTTTGVILRNILIADAATVLGRYNSRVTNINRKTYFYGVLVDVEVKIENTQVINYFVNNTSSSFLYTLSANELLASACSKLEAAGGSDERCPEENIPGQNLGLIIGCSVGGVVLLALIAGGAWYFSQKSSSAGKVFPGGGESNGRVHSVASSRSNVESRPTSSTPPTPPRVAYA